LTVIGLHVACGIAEIPCQAVCASVHVTRGARGLTQTRGVPRVVEMPAPDADRGRRGIEKAHARGLELARRVDCRDAGPGPVEDVESLTRLVQDQPGWSLPDLDRWKDADASSLAIDHDHVVGAHARDVAAGTGTIPDDAARISYGLVTLRLRERRRAVVE